VKTTVKNLQKKIKINPAQVRKIAYNIEPPASLRDMKLNLYFVDNSVIKKLNKQFFKKDSLTDVISFKLGDDYAEIFIAPSVVKDNALVFKAGFLEELHRCVVHGILHIFGYKDEAKKEKNKMWEVQEKILSAVLKKVRHK
jgi:rRNA maturation RNase YbeY